MSLIRLSHLSEGRIWVTRLKGSVSGEYPIHPTTRRRLWTYLSERSDDGQFLAQCLVLIRKAPQPIAKALAAVVVALLLWAAEGEVQAVSAEISAPARQALLAKIRKITRAKTTQARHEPRAIDLRVAVSENTLNVRIYPRTSDSRILRKLKLGAAVVALRSRKDWTLVTYKEGDAAITGWVYARYLKKVTRIEGVPLQLGGATARNRIG